MQPGMLMKPTTNPENHMIIGRAARAKGPLDPALLQQAFKHGSQDDHEWQNPINLAPAFAWLASQPSDRFQGLRFDAGMILQMLKAGGESLTHVSCEYENGASDVIYDRWVTTRTDHGSIGSPAERRQFKSTIEESRSRRRRSALRFGPHTSQAF
eukprot:SAG31_NODE_1799_length_7241_cov_11.407029_8_plen_155_part_00